MSMRENMKIPSHLNIKVMLFEKKYCCERNRVKIEYAIEEFDLLKKYEFHRSFNEKILQTSNLLYTKFNVCISPAYTWHNLSELYEKYLILIV